MAYNQPPHLGYNLVEATAPFLTVPREMTVGVDEAFSLLITGRNVRSLSLSKSILPDGTSKSYDVPAGFERTIDNVRHTITIEGTPAQEGDYQFVVQLTGLGSERVTDTLVVHAVNASGIGESFVRSAEKTTVYDLSGHRLHTSLECLPSGIYVITRETVNGVITRKIVK